MSKTELFSISPSFFSFSKTVVYAGPGVNVPDNAKNILKTYLINSKNGCKEITLVSITGNNYKLICKTDNEEKPLNLTFNNTDFVETPIQQQQQQPQQQPQPQQQQQQPPVTGGRNSRRRKSNKRPKRRTNKKHYKHIKRR